MFRLRLPIVVGCLLVVFAGVWLPPMFAQAVDAGPAVASPQAVDAVSPAAEPRDQPDTFFEILSAAGLIGYLIVALSVVAVALVAEQLFALRTQSVVPSGLADEVRGRLHEGALLQADAQCRDRPSALAYVIHAGLAEADGGWPAVEKAMEDALAEQSARMLRRIEYLAVIANIATMLGLLGTVVGLIMAFREVATTEGTARAADLAQGIYLALVTTVMGLVVAIPALAAFALLRNRIDQLMAETAFAAQHALGPIKRPRGVRRPTPSP